MTEIFLNGNGERGENGEGTEEGGKGTGEGAGAGTGGGAEEMREGEMKEAWRKMKESHLFTSSALEV